MAPYPISLNETKLQALKSWAIAIYVAATLVASVAYTLWAGWYFWIR